MATTLPSSTISPLSAGWKPDRIFMRVLLPAPFSPRMPWMVPGGHGEGDAVVGFDRAEMLADISDLYFHPNSGPVLFCGAR